jgi:hypothetical protein
MNGWMRVTDKIADALDSALSERGSIEHVIRIHTVSNNTGWNGVREPLNGMEIGELARLLFFGYKRESYVDRDVYARIRAEYLAKAKSGTFEHGCVSYMDSAHHGFINGMKYVLDELGVKITEVNA